MLAWRAGVVLCVTGAVLALVSLMLPWSDAMPEEWSPTVLRPRHLAELPPAQSWGTVLLLAVVGAGAAFCLAWGRRVPPASQLAFVLIAAAAAAAWLFRALEVLLRQGTMQGDVLAGASGVSTGYLLYAAGLGLVLLGVAVSGATPVPVRRGTRPWRVAGYRILVTVAVICVVPALMMPWYGIDVFYPDPDGPTELDVDAWRQVFLAATLTGLAMAGAAAWRPAFARVFRLIGLTAAVTALVFLIMGHEWLLTHEPATADYARLPPDSGLRGGLGASAALALAFLLLPPGPARRQSTSTPSGSAAAPA